jgi:hypothetical protein
MHLIPRPAGVVSDADSDSNSKPTSKSAAPRKAVQAEGPQASFEIHVALAHDGPPLSEGDDVAADQMEEWVTVYTAGWEARGFHSSKFRLNTMDSTRAVFVAETTYKSHEKCLG